MRNNGGMTSVAAAAGGATAQREERKTGGSLQSCSPAAGESCSTSWAKLLGSGTDLVVDNGVLWDHIRTPYNMQGSTSSGEMKDGWMNSAMSNEITWTNETNDALKKLVSTSPAGSGTKNINGNGLPNPNSFDSLTNYGAGSNNAANATGKFIFQGTLGADPYPCGSFTRLLDPSTTLDSADTMELGLEDFSSSGKANRQVQHQKVSSQTAAVPLKSPATAAFQSSNILTFHSNMSKMDMAGYCAHKPATTAQNQKVGGSPSDSSPSTSSSNNTLQKSTADEGGECTTEQKRSSDQAGLSNSGFKKPRTEASTSASAPMKVKKEKLGERITALQQLVSPFGKTDTASVLLEAMGYIKFLQDQVQVLSTPYLKGIPSSQNDQSKYDLRSRGLCLVPVSCTVNVANNNGADFWTSGLGSSAKF